MEKYMPSQRILEAICSDDKLVVQYSLLPRNSSQSLMKKSIVSISYGITAQIAKKYRLGEIYSSVGHMVPVLHLAIELLKNAIGHGDENSDIEFGLFLGNKGVCYGVRDGGDYFKSEEIKYNWENKNPVIMLEKGLENFSGFGLGNHIIFNYADIIEVNTKEGRLYCAQFKERLEKLLG